MAKTPRDAATVILARPTTDGSYEVLLTKRPESMKFFGGAYVFPGGAVDAGDASDDLARRSSLPRAEAAERLGEDIPPELALALYCCGLRETFEEVGVLLATEASGTPVDPASVAQRYAPRQRELGTPESFARFLAEEELTLATDLLIRHGRLITPEQVPIRFDARFFVAPFPEGAILHPDPEEVPEVLWVKPADAIRRSGTGELFVPIPTMVILQGLAEVPSYEQLLAGVRVVRDVHRAPLSPRVWHVLAPNPGLATGAGTNTYVVGDGDVAIIDPAVPDPAYIEAVARVAWDRGTPRLILLTHLHPDHVGGATVLAEKSGAEIACFEGALDAGPGATQGLSDGQRISLGGATLEVLYTPGHASHHVCFRLLEEGSLFAGDVVSGHTTVVIAPPDGNMARYLETLRRLRSLNPGRIYPGHGPLIEDGTAKLDEYIEHRLQREAQVVDALEAGLTAIPDIVKRIYTEVPESLHAMAEMSVLAHLEMLQEGGRVVRGGDAWKLTGP
jgi:glyoxylase-like metal-dependent hydrolase (beta-lactamase superfamily II)/8-oxo-dGTP pyrophosphatase MutT (NUDIX family)